MMAYTDRHCRYLHRLVSPSVGLFTEMVTTGALLHGPADRALAHNPSEHPVAIQLGGNEPSALAACAKMAAEAGFDEINLNVGCPSERVQEGRIGACLMAEPQLVAECFAAMAEAVSVPVTVKCRLGIDHHDDEPFLSRFVDTLAEAGCRRFYVHARIAILAGLSPAQNRSVPPLNYDRVYRLKKRRPELNVVLNGGITDDATALEALSRVDGVMIGRAAYSNPWLLARLHERLSGKASPSAVDMFEVFDAYVRYAEHEYEKGTRLSNLTRHALGLFNGMPGARRYRQILSDARRLRTEGPSVMLAAREALSGRAA